MRWLVLLQGQGVGCDYTIDCNKTWKQVEADSELEAVAKATALLGDFREPAIEEAMLVPMCNIVRLDLNSYYDEQEARQKAAEVEAQERHRRRMYEELKREFER